MSELLSRVLPFFRHPSVGFEGAFEREVPIFQPNGWTPRMAYVIPEEGGSPTFLTADEVQSLGLETVHEAALKNLSSRPAMWEVKQKAGGFLGTRSLPVKWSSPVPA